MSSISYCLNVIVALCAMIFLTRALPFMLGRGLQHNIKFKTIGQFLPAYMMLLLTIYEIKPNSFTTWPFALPAVISLFFLILVHLWRRQVVISLTIGTALYLFMTWLFTQFR